MPKVLTQDQIDSYERDGFLSPVTVMSPEEAGEFRKALEDAEAKWPEAFEGAGRNNSHLNLKFMDELVHDSQIVDAVEDLIGPNLLAYGTVLFIKEPNTPGFVSWHQDATYMGLTPYTEAVTVWLALSDSNPETGCMRMVPGSHKEGIRSHVDTYGESNILTRGQDIQNVDESEIVDLELVPGQMSFHHMAVIHGSQPNLSDKRRIGFVIQCYMKPEVSQKVKPVYAQHVRGEDSHSNFLATPRASGNMIAEDVARRDHCNEIWSDILYDGAEKRRDY
jgi:non-heme Fe2+,alpha-ketoglutarate-dependent halogenase